jgi:hypothetical protein
VLQVLPSAALGYYCYESFKLAVGVDWSDALNI